MHVLGVDSSTSALQATLLACWSLHAPPPDYYIHLQPNMCMENYTRSAASLAQFCVTHAHLV